MAFENLPGIFDYKVDGNLGQLPINNNPRVLVIGTAESGVSETPFAINTMASVTKNFGSLGTLSRGCFEAAASGALNILAYRIGATAAKVTGLGGISPLGFSVQTVEEDDLSGNDYSIFYDDSAHRVVVFRVLDGTIVYDNNPSSPDTRVDLGEVTVAGTFDGTNPGNVGTLSVPIVMSACGGVNGAVYTAGTDGTEPSKMKLWENLNDAYQFLQDVQFDIVVPMGVYLDDLNIQDLTTAQVSALQSGAPWASHNYPTSGTSYDALGKVFVQQYQGKNYYWWDMNRDGTAEIYPSGIGSANGTHDAFGVALTTASFHEVNFGYDLAYFCFQQSEDNAECLGVIGTNGPASLSLKDVAAWIGTAPTSVLSGTNLVITVNGTGLLGNKFMAGRVGNGGSGLPAFPINAIDGLAGGGFIAVSGSQFLDGGVDLVDDNDALVDLGKYISVVGAQGILSNPARDVSYISSTAAGYAGFFSSLPPNSAPTNKVISGARLPFRLNLTKLDALAGSQFVMYQQKSKGVVVSDAPTAARAGSDYNRLSTVRIVKAVLDAIRAAGDPFIGEPITSARLAALDTAIEQALSKLLKASYLQRYQHKVTATPADQVLGHATVDLILVPAFELRQISVSVSLAAQ